MTKGDITQYESLKLVDEIEFYHLLKNHENRMEIEAKYPRMSLF